MSGYKEMQGMPPPYTSGPPGGGYAHPEYAHPGYAPAPPVFQQQQSTNTNVVVVGQPSAPPPTNTVVHRPPQPNDFLVCTMVMLVICCIHGNILAVLLLIPALICSITASNHNKDGQHESAKQCGQLALCCNIFVGIKYILIVIAAVVVLCLFSLECLLLTADLTAVLISIQEILYAIKCALDVVYHLMAMTMH